MEWIVFGYAVAGAVGDVFHWTFSWVEDRLGAVCKAGYVQHTKSQ